MNKAELIEAVAARTGTSKVAAAEAVEAFLDAVIGATAKGDKVAIAGFGNFSKGHRKARTGRNPQTGATVKIKATDYPKFSAAANFKDIVAGKKKAAAKPAAKKAAAKKPAAKKAAAKPAAKKAAAKKAPAKKAAKKK